MVLTLFIATCAYGQVYEHSKLQKYVGYNSLYQHPTINRVQLDFLQYYVDKDGPWRREVNDYLRTGFWYGWVPEELDKSISAVDKLIETTPVLPKNIILFRGQNMSFMHRHYSIGEQFTDKTFFSTTSKQGIARFYSGYSSLSFVMVIYFEDEKARGLVMNNEDKEVLLARNNTFKIMDSVKRNKRRYGLVQVCPKSGCKIKVSKRKIQKWWNDFNSNYLAKDRDGDFPRETMPPRFVRSENPSYI